MTTDAALSELTAAGSAFEAECIVGALKANGIRAVVFGGDLADEFTMTQKLLGTGVRVMVAAEDLERARRVFAEIRGRRHE